MIRFSDNLRTDIDLLTLLNEIPTQFPVNISDDPGNYLCGYIYYKSLQRVHYLTSTGKKSGSVLFIHVPVIQSIPSDTVAQCLLHICNHLIKSKDTKHDCTL